MREQKQERNEHMCEPYSLQEWLVSIAMHNEAFRQQLRDCPRETLERELGLSFPVGVTIHVHEETATSIHLVLPMQSTKDETKDVAAEELAAVTTDHV
jgi:hypothetical protein